MVSLNTSWTQWDYSRAAAENFRLASRGETKDQCEWNHLLAFKRQISTEQWERSTLLPSRYIFLSTAGPLRARYESISVCLSIKWLRGYPLTEKRHWARLIIWQLKQTMKWSDGQCEFFAVQVTRHVWNVWNTDGFDLYPQQNPTVQNHSVFSKIPAVTIV